MSIQEKISEDLKTAMKARQADVVTSLRGLQSALKNKQIELQRDLEESEVLEVLKSSSKQLKDAMQDFVKGERQDLISKTQAELDLIAQFLPTPMERAQIREHVVKIASEVGATTLADMGKLMGAVVKAIGATANGDDVRKEVDAFLKEE
ncbi:hypothetical protein COV06_02870 [Candidatus Uhrbacteria bacterium CG10_big_fil_rev_8_21_14_0_10_50_16]|uniref:Glutamyl-tRNA amidotransferase n=1 Tax=Candidatus Uhrbacteria bacterium CG10_big_fil_rev_8_21_14_0_10_50_16 TaxID=1975039 RepID=A0A2H0RMA6_9BACT|nr:MAG: hypothetical protein COV06_02870 [Candidatus Uhrbacteria bacterium CG10_big_fil_rev_8_21_14_0_10_50_16]